MSRVKDAVYLSMEHIHEEGFEALILSGFSSTVATEMMRKAWMNLYPNQEMPPVHVIGHTGNELLYAPLFERRLDAEEEEPFWMNALNARKSPPKRELTLEKRIPKVEGYMDEMHPEIMALRGRNVAYVDKFASSGFKYEGLSKIFPAIGFQEMKYVFFVSLESTPLGDDVSTTRDDEATKYLHVLVPSLKGWSNRIFSVPGTMEQRKARVVADAWIEAKKMITYIGMPVQEP